MADLVVTVKNYVFKMLEIQAVDGMKALLMDDEATQMIALACSQTEIIMKDVVLVANIARPYPVDEKELKSTAHLKALCILRPTKESIDTLCKHLKKPQFSSYYIFFTNIVSQELLKQLAEADTHEVIRQVHEYYADFHSLTDKLFTINRPMTASLYNTRTYWRPNDKAVFARMVDGLAAVMLALKVKPQIRYASSSPFAKTLASELTKRISEHEQLFHFPQQNQNVTLMLLDRKDDPVTPLVQSWYYQAMVHEQLGITANRVSLANAPNVREDMKEIVLSTAQDDFFRRSVNLNFGEMGDAIKTLVAQYQAKSAITGKLDSLQDMQNFVDKYPEFRAMAGNVSKHVALLTELSRIVNAHSLMEVSELEQDIVCLGTGGSHGQIIESVSALLDNPRVRFQNKLNVVLLYALRFETERNNYISQFKAKLTHIAPDVAARMRIRAVDEVLRVCGQEKRGGDLFGSGSVWAKTASLVSSLKGVENVLTRHKPKMIDTLEALLRGKLRNREFPLSDTTGDDNRIPKPSTVLVFMLGGLTYAESASVATGILQNPEFGGVPVLLGSNTVHNSESFVSNILQDDGSSAEQEHISIDVL